jgi:hypothetical protein
MIPSHGSHEGKALRLSAKSTGRENVMELKSRLVLALIIVLSVVQGQPSNSQRGGPTSQSRPRIPKDGYLPHAGFVPTADVAIQIAEAVLTPVYGSSVVTSERPFHATLDRGVWIVKGTVPCAGVRPGGVCPGGNAEIWISKDNGQILYMIHSM